MDQLRKFPFDYFASVDKELNSPEYSYCIPVSTSCRELIAAVIVLVTAGKRLPGVGVAMQH